MIALDDLKNPVALGVLALVLLGAGLLFGLKLKADASDAAALAKRESAEVQAPQSSERATGSAVQDAANITTNNSAYDEAQGFIVPYRPECPQGAARKGAEPPAALKEWCERIGKSAGIKHGWYAEWYPDGRPSRAGEFRDGLRVGVWTRWYPNGKKRVQAQFKDGLQDGRLISWNEQGVKQGEQHYVQGEALQSGG